jgi:hypothetical protein
MILAFLYALGTAAVLGLPAGTPGAAPASWPRSPAWPVPPRSSPLSTWPAASACCTAAAPF